MVIMTKQLAATEEQEQYTFVQWLNLHNIAYAHVPNGGYRHIQTAKRMKDMGASPGMPDLLIFDPPAHYPEKVATAIEMKRKIKSRLTDHQKHWLKLLAQRKWLTFVAYGADDAIRFCEQAGYGRRNAK